MNPMKDAWKLLKEEKRATKKRKEKTHRLFEEKGGACSLDERCKACDRSKAECKKLIDSMDNVKISPHGDVILMDGL